MFYKIKIQDHIRVPPDLFAEGKEKAVLKRVKKDYEGYISANLGFVVDVISVDEIKEGIIIPGDGAAYYESVFNLLCFKPELKEVVLGKIKDIAEFGAFITLGPTDGMIHISQTMDDFVSFAKEKVLSGKDSGRHLKVNDPCRARLIAVSFKDLTNPKLGLTMRQEGLGKLEWLEQDAAKKVEVKEEEKEEKKKEAKK